MVLFKHKHTWKYQLQQFLWATILWNNSIAIRNDVLGSAEEWCKCSVPAHRGLQPLYRNTIQRRHCVFPVIKMNYLLIVKPWKREWQPPSKNIPPSHTYWCGAYITCMFETVLRSAADRVVAVLNTV